MGNKRVSTFKILVQGGGILIWLGRFDMNGKHINYNYRIVKLRLLTPYNLISA